MGLFSGHSSKASPWSGFLRFAFIFPVLNFFLTVVVFALSIYFGYSLTNPPPRDSNLQSLFNFPKEPSAAALVFYCGLVPLVALIWSGVTVLLHLLKAMSPVHAIVSSVLLIVGWGTIAGFWGVCEMFGGYEAGRVCPNIHYHTIAEWIRDPAFFDIAYSRVWIVVAIIAFYLCYLTFAAIAHTRQKKATRLGDKDVELERNRIRGGN